MRALILGLLCAVSAFGTAYTVTSNSTGLPSSVTTSFQPNGTPGAGDTCTIDHPLKITGNFTCGTISINGAAGWLGWDGGNWSITSSNQIGVITGCLPGSSGCPSGYSIDTCATAPTSTGNVLTWTVSGLSSAQGIFSAISQPLPYMTNVQMCNSVFNPGSGAVLNYADQYGVMDSSNWAFTNSKINGGASSMIIYGLGSISATNVSQTGASGELFRFIGPDQITGTVTGSIGNPVFSAINTTNGGQSGVSAGQHVSGVGIVPGTTVAALANQPATGITLSAAPVAGFTTGETLTFSAGCYTTNVTQVSSTSVVPFVNGTAIAAVPTLCVNSGEAVLSDSGGTYAPSLAQGILSIADSLEFSYYNNGTSVTQRCIDASTAGSTALHSTATHNAVDGCYEDQHAENYVDSLSNFFGGYGAQSTVGQGNIFGQGTGCPFTSTYDISVNWQDPGSSGIFWLNNTTGVTASSPCPVVKNATVVMGLNSGGGINAAFGEDDGMGGHFSVQNASIFNSLIVNGFTGIACRDTTSTWLNNGTGGVGSYNNDVIGAQNALYTKSGTCTNFDDGSHAHPNALYGDITANPNFQGTTQYGTYTGQPWAACDASLGGTGSLANMFGTVMFNRWQAAYTPPYTPSQVVDCLRKAFTPTNSALKSAGVGGAFIGALAPAVSGGIRRTVTQ
jgi:hypothetical protein